MSQSIFESMPIPDTGFGRRIRLVGDPGRAIAALESEPQPLLDEFYDADGLIVLEAMESINDDPALLVRLSHLFGPEVEDYRQTLTPARLIHESVAEIIVLSNLPPMSFPVPERPDPPTTADGGVPVQFPHRKGWHTDQSFRRPPPDVSLFYARQPCPKGQGQTLYANGTAAYRTLPEALKQRVADLEAIHAIPWTGRGEDAVRKGEVPKPLEPHQASQRQPIVRTHPVTGKPALYLCEEAQLDWILGPIAGLEPGPDGEGGQLVYELMRHYTQPKFTYVHDWNPGDLVIHDNRNLLHSATWFDAERHTRIMWRTTVMGNPGSEYTGESKSWIPADGRELMGDLDYA